MSFDTVPKDLKGLRACLVCSLIKTFEQFEYEGCDNCDEFLRMKNNKDNVYDCTSSNFDGLVFDKSRGDSCLPTFYTTATYEQQIIRMISLMSPEDSWVAKWQRTNRFCKGVYAISVSGRPPQGIIREMKSRGITYRSRDTSQR